MSDWIERQIVRRGVRDPRVLGALRAVPRERFVPAETRRHAHDDSALPIGHGQTISQPYIVALICASLELRGDERVLDVGTGSGYQAAVLSRLAAVVYSVELVPELAERARSNLAETGAPVEVVVGDGSHGLPEHAPYEAIAVAAAATEVPPDLYAQVRLGGRLVLPVGDVLLRVRKTGDGPVVEPLAPARFVPLRAGSSTPVL
jgi:protein-L-isoaspartate(D-aspartate) O-methyltransferase